MEIVDTTVNKSEVTFPNSDFREHSKKSLDSVAGETIGQKDFQGHIKTTINSELHNKTSEYREHSQKSRSSEETTAVQWSREVVPRTLKREMHLKYSEDREHSQNSRVQQTRTDLCNVDVIIHHYGQYSTGVSEFRECSSNSQMESDASQGTHHFESTKNACISEPSESLRDSPRGVGNNVSVTKFSWFKSMSQIVGLKAASQKNKVEGNPVGANTTSNAKTNSNPVHTEFNFFL